MNRLKRWFASIGIFFGTLFGYQYARPPVLETPTTIPAPSPSPSHDEPTHYPEMVLDEVRNATPEQAELARKAVILGEAILKNDCFEMQILKAKFTETNDLTNGQIYHLYIGTKLHVKVEFFYGTFMQNYVYKTMGYDVGDGVVYANSFYIDTPELLVSLIFHEKAHDLGFHHYGVMDTSAPYTMNRISEACLAVVAAEGAH